MSDHPKISIISTVYNTGPYLRPAVESILAQTFTDFELLLVDDGSHDGSAAVCDALAQEDARIRSMACGGPPARATASTPTAKKSKAAWSRSVRAACAMHRSFCSRRSRPAAFTDL